MARSSKELALLVLAHFLATLLDHAAHGFSCLEGGAGGAMSSPSGYRSQLRGGRREGRMRAERSIAGRIRGIFCFLLAISCPRCLIFLRLSLDEREK